MDAKLFGKKLKELRKGKNLTQLSLAKKLNVSDKLISKWENGLSIPNVEMLTEICNFFQININEIIETNNKNESKRLNLSKKTKNILLISSIFLFSTLIILVSYFHFVPMIFKNTFLSHLTEFNDNNFNNYFNFKMTLNIIDKTTNQTHKGIVNENEIVYEIKNDDKNDITFYNGTKIDFINYTKSVYDTSYIKNAMDLFIRVNESTQEGITFNKNDIDIYKIRKKGSLYKVFFNINYTYQGIKFKKGVFNCFVENDRITNIDIKILFVANNNKHTATGTYVFLEEMPQINIYEKAKAYRWNIKETDILEVPNEQIGGQISSKKFNNSYDFVGYKNSLIYYQQENNQYIIKFLDLDTEIEENIIFPDEINSLKLYFVFEDKLYLKCSSKSNDYYFYTYDLINKKFEKLDISASLWSELLLFDKVFIFDRLSKTESVSLDGSLKFNGRLVYKNKDTFLSYSNEIIYEYNDNILINEYQSSKYNDIVKIYQIDNDYYIFVNSIGMGEYFDKNMVYFDYFPKINVKFPNILNVADNQIYTSLGIFYKDFYKTPIAFSEKIDNVIVLDYYDVYLQKNTTNNYNCYIINKKA